MKRYIFLIAAAWIASVVLIAAYSPTPDKNFMTEINRLHETVSQALINGEDIAIDGSGQVQSIKAADINLLTPEQSRIFFTGADLKENTFIILPVGDTGCFIRYAVKTPASGKIPLLIFLSIAPMVALFALFITQREIIRPLRVMSEFPKQLAKGNFIYGANQNRNRFLHNFLWGLDMLRAKLDEQKNVNLRLEKERRTLVASLTHDIKTPLSSVITYGTAIKDGTYTTREEVENALDIILNKAEKIEHLTDDLLSSSVNALEEMTVEVAGHYLSELHQAIDKTVRNRTALLKMDCRVGQIGNDYIIPADIDRFIEACDNIIENAVKYGDMNRLTVNFGFEGGCVLVSFENTGGKIPETELKRIFSGFCRGSNAGGVEGHGLGLYIVKKIMRAMDGDVYAENTDEGVRITLVLKCM